ncbi:DUF3304 domain-containing protein [Burkholderia pseudomultivorans]|uniref:DUF3304 domain-containing protein n=1 Tax=Burkholderia pseudomultivorans TaxID=1207504 RepID=UPI0009BE17F5|nr:DUF3304 domain-containing protein [Burkholderia pseudomultivorans]
MLKSVNRWSGLLLTLIVVFAVDLACSQEVYGPYHVIGYNYTDRNIFLFNVEDFGAGSSEAHQAGGGGGITCCLEIPKRAKTLHIKIVYGWTEDQYEKRSARDIFETDIPMPDLPNKRDGYIEIHFLQDRKIEAKWVEFPTTPHILNAN